ncbi:MAG: RluA family pseudouridine synthase [Chloroflexi bacterium]|nr:RluA family pseudouridine synthase [Chloroflexota bacterium]
MEFVIIEKQQGQRLDVVLTETTEHLGSRSHMQRSILAGLVSIDGITTTRASTKVSSGQIIRVEPIKDYLTPAITPSELTLNVVFEDDDIAIIDKPSGMVVHSGAGHLTDTMANAAVTRWPKISAVGDTDRPGIVHRLDRDTSGLLIIALNPTSYDNLTAMIKRHEIERIYTTLVHGHPESSKGTIDAPVGRDPHHRTRQAVNEDGRPALTHYEVIREIGQFSFLKIRLETGRMHQIRVHMTAIGHPVVGDQTYGKRQGIENLSRQFLHASKLIFNHPISSEKVSVTSHLPDDLRSAISLIE